MKRSGEKKGREGRPKGNAKRSGGQEEKGRNRLFVNREARRETIARNSACSHAPMRFRSE